MAAPESTAARSRRRLLLLPAPASGKTVTFDRLVEQVTFTATETLPQKVRVIDNLTALMGRPCAVVECDASAAEFSQLCQRLATDDWMAVDADEIVTVRASAATQAPGGRDRQPHSPTPPETPDDDPLAR